MWLLIVPVGCLIALVVVRRPITSRKRRVVELGLALLAATFLALGMLRMRQHEDLSAHVSVACEEVAGSLDEYSIALPRQQDGTFNLLYADRYRGAVSMARHALEVCVPNRFACRELVAGSQGGDPEALQALADAIRSGSSCE